METETEVLSRASNRLKALYGVISATHGDEETLKALKLAIELIDTVNNYTHYTTNQTTQKIKEDNTNE